MPCARRRFTQADDRCGVEAELRDDDDAKASLRGGFELGGEQAVKLQIGEARVAVGVTRDADFRDAAARDQSGVDRLQRAAQRAGGLGAVARDHQKLSHVRLAGQPVEQMLQRVGGDEVAHRKVRHRLEARRAHARRLLHDLFLRPCRDGAEIDRRAGRQRDLQRCDIRQVRAGRFKRRAAHERRDIRGDLGRIGRPARR
jgi:hypothetical protein